MFWRPLIAMLLLGTLIAPADASDAAREATARNLAAGTLAAGDLELSQLVAKDGRDQEAKFGLGVVRIANAVATLAQNYYRYGARSPRGLELLYPIALAGIPGNPNPQPIRYNDFRQILQQFVTDLGRADATLAAVDDPAVKLPLNLTAIAIDVDGDGKISPAEGQLMTTFIAGRGRGSRNVPSADTTVAFDLGDASWFRGYANLLMALGEFLLAYDFHDTFDGTFHLFFAKVSSPMADALAAANPTSVMGLPSDSIADAIAFIHLIRWPVAEKQRMSVVRDHLKAAVALSRRTWDAIEAETDDDHEWLPSPKQTSALVPMMVTVAQIASWRSALDEADAVLDGKKLVPNWRFKKGVDLKRFFDQPMTFDLVLWFTGQGALPYLADGPISDTNVWSRLNSTFGRNPAGYFFWFN